MSEFFTLLAMLKPTERTVTFLRRNFDRLKAAGQEIPEEDERWLSMVPAWDAWMIELEKRMTDDDERLLKELAAVFETEVKVTVLRQAQEPPVVELIETQATLIQVKDKPTI